MSGRGKGGKGLGKGGAKRHRKVLRDNIQGERTQPASYCCILVGQWQVRGLVFELVVGTELAVYVLCSAPQPLLALRVARYTT